MLFLLNTFYTFTHRRTHAYWNRFITQAMAVWVLRSAFASKRSFVRSFDLKHGKCARLTSICQLYDGFVFFFISCVCVLYLFTEMMVCLHSRVSVFISTCLCVAISVDRANWIFRRFSIHAFLLVSIAEADSNGEITKKKWSVFKFKPIH